jgi:hypothetical protein
MFTGKFKLLSCFKNVLMTQTRMKEDRRLFDCMPSEPGLSYVIASIMEGKHFYQNVLANCLVMSNVYDIGYSKIESGETAYSYTNFYSIMFVMIMMEYLFMLSSVNYGTYIKNDFGQSINFKKKTTFE